MPELPALTRDEAARRLTVHQMEWIRRALRESAELGRDSVLCALYGPPVETPTPEV